MAKERKDKHFLKTPIYEGGPSALKKFIAENKRYPKAAEENKIEGTVVLRYSISHKGKVIDAKIISGLGFGCDEEAKRLVKMLQFKVPKNRGMRATFHKEIKIHFRKPEKSKSKKLSYQYSLTSARPSDASSPIEKSNKKKDGTSYTITINFGS